MFLGRSVTQHKQVSDVTAHAIDEEVRRVIENNYPAPRGCSTNLDKLHTMAEALMSTRPSMRTSSRTSWRASQPRPAADWDETLSNKPPKPRRRRTEASPPRRSEAGREHSRAPQDGSSHGRAPYGPDDLASCRDATSLMLDRPVVMGVSQRDPDSFSDGGYCLASRSGRARGRGWSHEGAAIIDVGGESTRPGSAGVDRAVECERVVPVIERSRDRRRGHLDRLE